MVRFPPAATPAELQRSGFEYAVLDDLVLKLSGAGTIERWMEGAEAELIEQVTARRMSPEAPPESTFLVRLSAQ